MLLIRLKNVHKIYPNGFQALKEVNLRIRKGEFVSIIGPSGAGKTTLTRLINGLEKVSTGQVIVDQLEVEKYHLKRIRSIVGMIFQHFNLVDQLNVMTNVLCGRLSHRNLIQSLFYLFSKNDMKIAEETLLRVGLADKAWSRADKLSGGQQQRVGVARALAQQPKIILADEPVASLDPVIGEELMELLKEICVNDGITVLANLHQLDFAKKYADRIIGLRSGEVVFDGTAEELDDKAYDMIYRKNRLNKVGGGKE